MAFVLRFRETDLRAAHRYAGGNGNTSLLVVVDGTIEVVYHPIVLYNIALMGKHLVIGFRGPDEVFTLPTLPMDEVARDSKGVESIILARRVVGLEIKHHIQVAHLGNLSITCDDTTHLVGKNGVTIIALPFLQVVR